MKSVCNVFGSITSPCANAVSTIVPWIINVAIIERIMVHTPSIRQVWLLIISNRESALVHGSPAAPFRLIFLQQRLQFGHDLRLLEP